LPINKRIIYSKNVSAKIWMKRKVVKSRRLQTPSSIKAKIEVAKPRSNVFAS